MSDDFPRGFVPPLFGDAPVGSVVAFAGKLGPPDALTSPPQPASSPPTPAAGTTWPIEATGWMACDGRMLLVAAYPELFQALGYLYGGSDLSFAVPNYGGYFMRGMGGVAAVDPEPATRTAAPGGEQAGVGSTQGFALQTHEHNYLESQASAPGETGEAGAPGPTTKKTQGGPVTADGASPPVQVSPKETRPVNIYVNYIIKFTAGLKRAP
ncbi:MAG: tail fiber protein [Allosphingosinicella sp.]